MESEAKSGANGGLARWALIAAALAASGAPATALADEESVRTTGGDVIRGDVLDYRAGEDAVVELANGRRVRIPAERVARVDVRMRPAERIPSLAAPFIAMPVGLVFGLLGGGVAAMASWCTDWSGDCETDDEMVTLGIGIAVVGGLVFAMGAFVLLPIRVVKRRAWRERQSVRITPSLGRRGGSLMLGASF